MPDVIARHHPIGGVQRVLPAATPAIAAATQAAVQRVPWHIDGQRVGSVAVAHLPLLAEAGSSFALGAGAVAFNAPASERDAVLAQLHQRWREQGVIRAWRDETYPVVCVDKPGPVLAHIERAAARFWGTLTLGAHANGFVSGAGGRPAALWIAQRAFNKPTDPGLFDNLVGGGVAAGQSPTQALVREAWEEAGLHPAQCSRMQLGSVLRLARDVPEGFQLEHLHSFDIELPASTVPCNQDGEVAGFRLLSCDDALALASGNTMTVDAALVTLDFICRHALLAGEQQRADLHAALADLRITQPERSHIS